MSDTDRSIDVIAASMWNLVRSSLDRDWDWCLLNEPALAMELRIKAAAAIETAGLIYSDRRPRRTASSSTEQQPTQLDLRFKEALISTDGAK
jgi:hypothetical protein